DVALAQASQQEIARGRYVFGATGGCGCHTAKGQPANAGGRRYDGPFGTVYSSNITPDRETGIGSWTDEQIVTATRLGRRSNGERLLPVHPYPVFNGMAAEDLKAPEDQAMPNITPDPDTGIGKWTVEQIADYLGTGNKPDGDVAGGLMGEVIDGTLAGYKDLTQGDRVAIAQYLKTLPPIRNKIAKEK